MNNNDKKISSSTLKDLSRLSKEREIKFKRYSQPKFVDKRKEIAQAIENAEKAANEGANVDMFSNVNEKYAHDLIMYAAIFEIINNTIEAQRTKDMQELLKKKEQGEFADKKFKHNMNTYFDFKTQFKYQKVLEAKLQNKNLSPTEQDSLKAMHQSATNKLDDISKEFEFKSTEGQILKFQNTNEVVNFLEKIESENMSKSYRTDIMDASELNKIFDTNIKELYKLAEETKDHFNSYSASQNQAIIKSK